jgi:hypothetical protein
VSRRQDGCALKVFNGNWQVGYKPPPPAFQIGKAALGELSAKQNLP